MLYVYIGGDNGLYQIWKQNRKKALLAEEIREQEELKAKNEEEKVKLIKKDTDYIEEKAREELGMVKQGEQVYIITRDKQDKK